MSSKIVVEYYPFGEPSPFPESTATVWSFNSHEEFKSWVQGYVCKHCLVDFLEFTGKEPETLRDWLHMGCGCEIGVSDIDNLIKWDDQMTLTTEQRMALDEWKEF